MFAHTTNAGRDNTPTPGAGVGVCRGRLAKREQRDNDGRENGARDHRRPRSARHHATAPAHTSHGTGPMSDSRRAVSGDMSGRIIAAPAPARVPVVRVAVSVGISAG